MRRTADVSDTAATAVGPTFACLRSDEGATIEITVRGDLDVASAPSLDRVLRGAQAEAKTVVLDLRELQFIDSRGAQTVLDADRRARAAGGRLEVIRGAEVAWYFQLSGIDRQLVLVDRPIESHL